MSITASERITDRVVLLVISAGLIAILLAIIAGLFGWFKSRANVPLPNWAENVLVSIATASALKLGDCLATLIALSSGRSVERLGTQLAASGPATDPPPADAAEGAQQAADAAQSKAEEISSHTEPEPEPEKDAAALAAELKAKSQP